MALNPGDLVYDTKNSRLVTVKTVGGGEFVLCAWMEKDANKNPVECSGAIHWQELRTPTPEELANKPRELQTIAAADVGELPAEVVESHKRKGK